MTSKSGEQVSASCVRHADNWVPFFFILHEIEGCATVSQSLNGYNSWKPSPHPPVLLPIVVREAIE